MRIRQYFAILLAVSIIVMVLLIWVSYTSESAELIRAYLDTNSVQYRSQQLSYATHKELQDGFQKVEITVLSNEMLPPANRVSEWEYPLENWDTVVRFSSVIGNYRSASDPYHKGVDLVYDSPGAIAGATVLAANDGKVIIGKTSGQGTGTGNWAAIEHSNGIVTLYMHLQEAPLVNVGDTVSKGQPIGKVGNTGPGVTGYHLHFETRQGSVGGKHIDAATLYGYENMPPKQGNPSLSYKEQFEKEQALKSN